MRRPALALPLVLALVACEHGALPAAADPPPPTGRVQDENRPSPRPGAPAADQAEATPMGCDAEAAMWMLGRPRDDVLLERARIDAGAQVARYIRHDEMVTMEFHPSRLNVDLDASGRVRAVRCG